MTDSIRITRVERGNVHYFDFMLPPEYDFGVPNRYCLGAVCDDRVTGVIVFSTDRMMCYIDWIYISTADRRKGIATALVEKVKEILRGSGILGISAVYFERDKSLNQFFSNKGFGLFMGDTGYSLSLNDIAAAPGIKSIMARRDTEQIESLENIKTSSLNRLKGFLTENIMTDAPVFKCSKRYSFLATKDDEIKGCVLCRAMDVHNVTVELLLSTSETFFTAVALLKGLLFALKDDGQKGVSLSFVAANEEITDFVEYATGYTKEDLGYTPTCYAVLAI